MIGLKHQKMTKKTVLVKYKKWNEAPHALLDGNFSKHSKIVTVTDLEDINDMFDHIEDVKVIDKNI